jgi:hypothetical protein
MDSTTILQILTLFSVLLTGGAVPFILARQREARITREARFNAIDDSINHIDQCLDRLNNEVQGKLINRGELNEFRVEVQNDLNRMRTAISNDTNGLHDRILRLESFHMGTKS